jgi:hypothetical protein
MGPRMVVGGEFGDAGGLPAQSLAAWSACPKCRANCDGSVVAPILNVNDFVCFMSTYAAGDAAANCDGSTTVPVLNINDFVCFVGAFAAGCP